MKTNLEQQIEKDVKKAKTFLTENTNAKIELNYYDVSIENIKYFEKQWEREASYLPINKYLHLMGVYDCCYVFLTSIKHHIKYEIIENEEFDKQLTKDKRDEDYIDYRKDLDANKKENLNENIN